MTGTERLDFKDLREEMREGFRGVNNGLEKLAGRVGSLEITRAEQKGAAEAERCADDEREAAQAAGRAKFMWMVGLVVSTLSILGGLAVNLVIHFLERGGV